MSLTIPYHDSLAESLWAELFVLARARRSAAHNRLWADVLARAPRPSSTFSTHDKDEV